MRHRTEGAATADCSPAALAAIGVLPALLHQAEDADAAVLARHLGQVLTEAEGIVQRSRNLLPGDVRARLAALESYRLVGSRQGPNASPSRRVFFATAEGRRAAWVVDDAQHTVCGKQ